MVNFFFFGLIAFVMLSLAENAGSFVKGMLTIPALLILAFLSILLSLGPNRHRPTPRRTPLPRHAFVEAKPLEHRNFMHCLRIALCRLVSAFTLRRLRRYWRNDFGILSA
jgi:hypothetical protein